MALNTHGQADTLAHTQPRIIIHGGAGNITHANLPPSEYARYSKSLLAILHKAHEQLLVPGATAVDVATYAVQLLEADPLFNAGRGSAFTCEGLHELEASLMVSKGLKKRGIGLTNVRKTKSPISLAREILLRGGLEVGDGTQSYSEIQGKACDDLAHEWGLEVVNPSYFWTRQRWDEHRKTLGLPYDDGTYESHKREVDEVRDQRTIRSSSIADGRSLVDAHNGASSLHDPKFLPQGAVGAVVIDDAGVLCVAMSTANSTNGQTTKIQRSSTINAGFFTESLLTTTTKQIPGVLAAKPLSQIGRILSDCLMSANLVSPARSRIKRVDSGTEIASSESDVSNKFIRSSVVRTGAAIIQYSSIVLDESVAEFAGLNALLPQSSEDPWQSQVRGGGLVGIYSRGGQGKIVAKFDCDGMLHAFIDDHGEAIFRVFREDVKE